jgi:hypothetical protein
MLHDNKDFDDRFRFSTATATLFDGGAGHHMK